MIILEIKFTFLDWKNEKVTSFRESATEFIGLNHARSSLLLSSELNEHGISFYLLTIDSVLASNAKSKFNMIPLSYDVDLTSLGYEYGNSELLK